MSEEYELTPLSNVAFKGAVAEEINRLSHEVKRIQAQSSSWRATAMALAHLLFADRMDSKAIETYVTELYHVTNGHQESSFFN